jgi:hypothetical protein
MIRESPATEDAFERARKASFGTAEKTPKTNTSPIFPRLRNELLGRETQSSGRDGYSGMLLSSQTAIRQLRSVARRLMHQGETMLDPEFFLASLSRGWRPRVVAVTRTRDLVGIMYAKERVLSGIPTGIVYGDGSLGSLLLGNPLHQQNTLRVAIKTLLGSPGIRGVRLRVLQDSRELDAVRKSVVSGSIDAEYSHVLHNDSPLWKYHAHLPLADTYDQFLKRLGSTTRHNFRYYRRRFEASGHRFIEFLSIDELRSAVLDLASKSKFTARLRRTDIERTLNMINATGRPLAVGLKHHNGEWLGVIGGWYVPRGAVLCFQCHNECAFGHDSLSLVLRAYLIELLIRQGLEELVIWADTGPPLSRYVTYVPTTVVRLDRPTYTWRMARLFFSKIGPRLPGRLAGAAQWIAG